MQDIRATEKDKVKIADCFRGGDVVKGVVVSLIHGHISSAFLIYCFIQISLGDARNYYVTTARNDLGVIFATSEAGMSCCVLCNMPTLISAIPASGATMEPVSWQEMRCPKTGRTEKRKCAKPEGF